VHRRRGAAVGHMGDVDLGGELEQFAGEMRQAAGAGGREVELARLFLGERDQLLHVVGGDAGRHHQHFRHFGDQRDGREILERVVGHLLHAGRDGERAGADDADGVAVGLGLGDHVGAEHAGLAGAVLDHDGLLEDLGHALRDHARDHVVRPARRERHDQPDGLARKALRRRQRRREQGTSDQQRSQEFHGHPPQTVLSLSGNVAAARHSVYTRPPSAARRSMTGKIDLLVLEGDGIGPEIMAATLAVLRAAARAFALDLAFESETIGWAAHRMAGTTLPPAVIDKAKAAAGVLLGPVSHNEYPPPEQGGRNPSGELRKALDLYANIRPARSRTGFPPRCGKPVDLVIVRENTEGFYADRSMHLGHGEFMPTPDLALAVRKITRQGSTRIAESAFRLAMQRRNKVTAVHKANVLRVSDGLYLECVRAVAARHPQVAYEERIIDAMAALLVRDASQFDVVVTTNMYGDILSDEASEIAGSLGLAASLNAGAEHGVAQAQHGSAPDI